MRRVGRALSSSERKEVLPRKGKIVPMLCSPVQKKRCAHCEPVTEDTVTVPLTDSPGSSLRPASEPTFLSVLQVLKDTFGMFLFLHL